MSASTSPMRWRGSTDTSMPVRITTPSREMAMPTHADRGMCAPRHRAMRAAQTGWVATRAVDDATVVNRSDGIHVAKCSPRSSPDDPISHHSWRLRRRTSVRCRHMTHGAVAAEPRKQRQKAIARAGATVAAMIGPDEEMNRTATPSQTRSAVGGRPRVGAELVGAAMTCPLPRRR